MTVAELIEQLKTMPQDLQVYAGGKRVDDVAVTHCGDMVYVKIFKDLEREFEAESEQSEAKKFVRIAKAYVC